MMRIVLCFFCLLSVVGCTNAVLQVQAQTANAVAQAANAGLPLLVDSFRQEGFDALELVKVRGGTEQEARSAVAAIEAEWKPIWDAWLLLRTAQDVWATAIESGGDTASALQQMRVAYCRLRSVWPKTLPAVPLAPLRCADE